MENPPPVKACDFLMMIKVERSLFFQFLSLTLSPRDVKLCKDFPALIQIENKFFFYLFLLRSFKLFCTMPCDRDHAPPCHSHGWPSRTHRKPLLSFVLTVFSLEAPRKESKEGGVGCVCVSAGQLSQSTQFRRPSEGDEASITTERITTFSEALL